VANKDAENGKCSGRKSYVESRPDTVALAKRLQGEGFSYRKIAGRLYVEGQPPNGTRSDVRCQCDSKDAGPELTQRRPPIESKRRIILGLSAA
jgi:hypothetical protein